MGACFARVEVLVDYSSMRSSDDSFISDCNGLSKDCVVANYNSLHAELVPHLLLQMDSWFDILHLDVDPYKTHKQLEGKGVLY